MPYTCAGVTAEAGPGRTDARLRSELRLVIRRARERMKLSQEELAKLLGTSQSQVSDWERGRNEPGASVLLAVAELANTSIDELRTGGPATVLRRLERLEDEVEQLVTGTSEDGVQLEADDVTERLEAVEREVERIGALLAKLIQILDQAGLWPGQEATRPTRVRRSRT